MDPYLYENRPPRPSKEPPREQLDAFAQIGASEHETEIQLLIPIAQRLARESGAEGCTVADVREEAARRGLIPPLGKGRSLSYLGALMKRAGLVATDRTRRSHIEGSNGNRGTVWISTEYVREDAA